MTAEPVQVLVTIHPPEDAHEDWERADWASRVHMALYHEWSHTTLSPQRYDVEHVHGQPHGEAQTHREAADRELAVAEKYGAPPEYVALNGILAAITHALLALGERP